MRYFFIASTIFVVLSLIVLLMQEIGTLNFMVCLIAFIAFAIVMVGSGIYIRISSRRNQ